MTATWYWWAAVGTSGVQPLPRQGPEADLIARQAEQRSAPWRTQRSPSFALYRFGRVLAVVCDALRTHTADEHNRLMRARFTLVMPDGEVEGPLRLALGYFATAAAPALESVNGRLRLPPGWDRPASARLPVASAAGDAERQVRVAEPDAFVRAVLNLLSDSGTLRHTGSGLVCLYSEWLKPEDLPQVAAAAVVGGPNLVPGTHPKADGSRSDRAAPRRRLTIALLGALLILALAAGVAAALLL